MTFDLECKQLNKKYHKNQSYGEVKTHQYIISFDPKDIKEHGLTGEKAQKLGLEYARKNFPGHQILVATHTDGNNKSGSPLEAGTIRVSFNKLIEEHHLPKVVFHSLRHSSVTYKLKLNKGDIKAVQGDSGHSQTDMVTNVYSHIIDEDRKKNAELFEDAFYKKNNLEPNMVSEEVDMELLMKALANPEMRALLNSLAKTMK